MATALYADEAPVPPPSYHRTVAMALHLDALTLITRLHLLAVCRVAVQLAQQQCPPPLSRWSGWSTTALCRGILAAAGAAADAVAPVVSRGPRLVMRLAAAGACLRAASWHQRPASGT
jgi:hypothetical protein